MNATRSLKTLVASVAVVMTLSVAAAPAFAAKGGSGHGGKGSGGTTTVVWQPDWCNNNCIVISLI